MLDEYPIHTAWLKTVRRISFSAVLIGSILIVLLLLGPANVATASYIAMVAGPSIGAVVLWLSTQLVRGEPHDDSADQTIRLIFYSAAAIIVLAVVVYVAQLLPGIHGVARQQLTYVASTMGIFGLIVGSIGAMAYGARN